MEEYFLAGEGIPFTELPKVLLHDHLDGGLRPATILDLASETGVPVPAEEPTELAEWFAETAHSGSLTDYLATFETTVAVMQTAPALERVAREYVADLAADGVVYGEVRWAPELHQRSGLSLDEAVDAVREGLDQGMQEAAAQGHRLRVGQLIAAMRDGERSFEIAELALRHRERGVVGFDLAGAEAGFPASLHRRAFELLASEHFPTTVHAGESAGVDSICSALHDGRALRLGHGVRLAEDISLVRHDDDASYVTLGELSEWVKDREIALELSPSSNLHTGAVAAWGTELTEHPFDLLYQLGFRVSVNTDNRLMSATTLSRELALLADAFGYDLDDLETFQINAAQASFLPRDERHELIELINSGFEAA
ncbi:adenosine deaminase [Rathayibacter toxicus]|nr:adenosine deaminase [Rathayibacter toxicus]